MTIKDYAKKYSHRILFGVYLISAYLLTQTQIFDSRETVYGSLIILILIASLAVDVIRKQASKVIKALISIKLFTLFITFCIYFGMCIYLLYVFNLWQLADLKNTIIWFIFIGLINHAGNSIEKGIYLLRFFRRNIFTILIVSELIFLQTLNFIFELLFFIVGLFYSFSYKMSQYRNPLHKYIKDIPSIRIGEFIHMISKDKVESDPRHNLVTKILFYTMILLILYLIGNLIYINIMGSSYYKLIKDFFTPIGFTIIIIPYLWMLNKYSKWENKKYNKALATNTRILTIKSLEKKCLVSSEQSNPDLIKYIKNNIHFKESFQHILTKITSIEPGNTHSVVIKYKVKNKEGIYKDKGALVHIDNKNCKVKSILMGDPKKDFEINKRGGKISQILKKCYRVYERDSKISKLKKEIAPDDYIKYLIPSRNTNTTNIKLNKLRKLYPKFNWVNSKDTQFDSEVFVAFPYVTENERKIIIGTINKTYGKWFYIDLGVNNKFRLKLISIISGNIILKNLEFLLKDKKVISNTFEGIIEKSKIQEIYNKLEKDLK